MLCTVSYHGSGSCINVLDSSWDSSASLGGRFGGYTIDGTSAGSSAAGMSWGDMLKARCADISIQDFSGASAVGLQMKNSAGWSEQGEWTAIRLSGNTVNVLFDTGSFDYSVYQFVIEAQNGQDGIRMQNGATLTGVRLEMRGNFIAGSGNTAAAIAMDRGNASGTSRIYGAHFYICAEADGTGTAHQSILMGGGSSSQFNGMGLLSFGLGSGGLHFQGATVNSQFGVIGFVLDPNGLGTMTAGDAAAVHGGLQWAAAGGVASAFGGTIYLQKGDVQAWQLFSGSNSLVFSGSLLRARRIELFLVQPASGSAGTVSWPAGVTWLSGSAPVLQAANSAVDRIRLTYLPSSSTWYGEYVSGLQLDATASDIQPAGTAASAGNKGLAADAGHVHTQNRGGVFGDGSDGAVTLDGSTTYSGFGAPSGNVYTMSRDVFCTSLVIDSGVTLKPAGYRVFVAGAITGTGTISANGNSGSGASAGGSSGSGTLTGGRPGGAGGTTSPAAGSNGTNSTVGTPAAGNGGAGTDAAGNGGSPVSSSVTFFRVPFNALAAIVPGIDAANGNGPSGGAGGGGGGGSTGGAGGGGGGGGGPVFVFAWSIASGIAITATGGAGGNASGNGGGGGGGTGGLVLLYTLSAWGGTATLTAGGAGSGAGTGSNGSAGGTGNSLNVIVS